MEILHQHKHIRLIRRGGKFVVQLQVRRWFRKKWKDITFGPYGPFPIGVKEFTYWVAIRDEYARCCHYDKNYSLRGVND